MDIKELQERLSSLIYDAMAGPNEETKTYLSNLRVFYDLSEHGKTNDLKNVLVNNFSEIYCHTMADVDPVDVLTVHYIQYGAFEEMVKTSTSSITEN